MPTVCSSVLVIPLANFLLICGALAKPDWTETRAPREAKPPPRCVARLKMLVSVCISFCCCSVCLRIWQQNCHLLCCTCLCLLRKLLQYLWLLRNCVWGGGCACEWLYVCLWMQDYGKSSTHLTELFPVLLSSYFIFFSLVALCSPNQGFITKQVSPLYHTTTTR